MLNIVDGLARRLHEYYLDATEHLDPENYNANAQKSYDDLTEEQKSIDVFIADRLISDIFGL